MTSNVREKITKCIQREVTTEKLKYFLNFNAKKPKYLQKQCELKERIRAKFIEDNDLSYFNMGRN